MKQEYAIHPEIDLDSAPYWRSLREHQARLQRCGKCGQYRFPPAPSCTHCGTLGGTWEPISGLGTVYSWTVVHNAIDRRLAGQAPFVIALVELKEGPRVATRLVNCNPGRIRIGLPLVGRYDDVDGDLTLLNFEPQE